MKLILQQTLGLSLQPLIRILGKNTVWEHFCHLILVIIICLIVSILCHYLALAEAVREVFWANIHFGYAARRSAADLVQAALEMAWRRGRAILGVCLSFGGVLFNQHTCPSNQDHLAQPIKILWAGAAFCIATRRLRAKS